MRRMFLCTFSGISISGVFVYYFYYLSDKVYDITPGPIFTLIFASIFFTMILSSIALLLNYIKKDFRQEGNCKSLVLVGFFLQLISIFFISLAYIYTFSLPILLVASLTLLCLGLYLHNKHKKDISISFITWAIGVFSLIIILANVSYGTMGSW